MDYQKLYVNEVLTNGILSYLTFLSCSALSVCVNNYLEKHVSMSVMSVGSFIYSFYKFSTFHKIPSRSVRIDNHGTMIYIDKSPGERLANLIKIMGSLGLMNGPPMNEVDRARPGIIAYSSLISVGTAGTIFLIASKLNERKIYLKDNIHPVTIGGLLGLITAALMTLSLTSTGKKYLKSLVLLEFNLFNIMFATDCQIIINNYKNGQLDKYGDSAIIGAGLIYYFQRYVMYIANIYPCAVYK